VTGAEPGRARWVRRALWLVSGTMAYNAAEALVALWAGNASDSIALVGFGLDSVIEMAAAGVVLWRMALEARGVPGDRLGETEERVRRFVGATFFALSVYVVAEAGTTLWRGTGPRSSVVGIGLALLSLGIMPLLAWGKLRAARALDSRGLAAEAKETLACAYLSFALLVGLAAHALAGWWWADPVAALCMVPWLLREGWEAFAE
jgi:divalent metal cation (Fe/Co/Zn/Cd) transporter